MTSRKFGLIVAAAALFGGLVATAAVQVATAPTADAAARARRGTLGGAAYVAGTGMVFRISGENLASATWSRRQTTDRSGAVTGEAGTVVAGRRTYSYVASISTSSRSRSVNGRLTVRGGILSPRTQNVRF